MNCDYNSIRLCLHYSVHFNCFFNSNSNRSFITVMQSNDLEIHKYFQKQQILVDIQVQQIIAGTCSISNKIYIIYTLYIKVLQKI